MFCGNCGNNLEDTAKFCDKCGKPTGIDEMHSNINISNKKIDNKIKFIVKPTFKLWHFISIFLFFILFICLFVMIIGLLMGSDMIKFSELLIIDLVFFVITILPIFIGAYFRKAQIKNMQYTFYNTKVVYKDSFISQIEKEVKYKHIRECVLKRTIIDRMFDLGQIVLFTNAESGYGNGISIPAVENSIEIYKQIKEILDEE